MQQSGWFPLCGALVFLVGSTISPTFAQPAAVVVRPSDEPANVGEAKRAATEYHSSGRYGRALAEVAAGLGWYIVPDERNIIKFIVFPPAR